MALGVFSTMRIGVDVGGTKIEALAMDSTGLELRRHRVDTPRNYEGTIAAIVGLVNLSIMAAQRFEGHVAGVLA